MRAFSKKPVKIIARRAISDDDVATNICPALSFNTLQTRLSHASVDYDRN